MKTISKMAAIAGILVPCVAASQDSSTKMMMGKPGSLYAKYGIHKIAAIVSDCVDSHASDEVLLGNERIAMMKKNTPAPFLKFMVTTWVAHHSGGPQVPGLEGMPNAGQIAKSFMMTPAQWKRFGDTIATAAMKNGITETDAKKMSMMTMEWIDKSKPMMMPASEMFKDPTSLYARLGGIAPVALVVDEFINQLAGDATVGSNPNIGKSLTSGKVSVAGIKFLVTEQLAAAAGGPWKYTGRDMSSSHKDLMINEKEWEAGAGVLKRVLDKFMVPAKEQGEIFAVIASTKKDIVKGGTRR